MDNPPVQPESTDKRTIRILGSLLAVALLGDAALGFMAYQNSNKASDATAQSSSLSTRLTAANADKAKLSDEVKTLTAAASSPSPAASPAPSASPAVDDKTAATQALKAQCEAQVAGGKASSCTVTISQLSGTFASGNASPGVGGYHAILKKVNGVWVVVIAGQDAPTASMRATYGVPANIQ